PALRPGRNSGSALVAGILRLVRPARRLLGRDAVDALEPAAEIDLGAAARAEGAVALLRGLTADRARLGAAALRRWRRRLHARLDRVRRDGCRRPRAGVRDRRRLQEAAPAAPRRGAAPAPRR